MKRKRINDLILVVSVIIIAFALFFFYYSGESGEYVVVNINGIEVERHSLKIDGTFSLNNGSNILVIQDGKAYLIEANCPDKLCVKQGKIDKTGQCITCLPNKLTVTIVGGNKGVDLVSE